MAELINTWIAGNGKMFDTREEAEQEDFIAELCDVLDEGGNENWEFDTEAAVRHMLEKYTVTPKSEQPE